MSENDFTSQTADISPLPSYLVKKFKNWQSTEYAKNKPLYESLAKGQQPSAMVISCCDSRVHSMTLFGAESGELFIHRNIANLVPPFDPSGGHHGTSSAIEFAVSHLGVAHIIVLGHSSCGGILGGFGLCKNGDKSPIAKTTFIGKWVELIKPAYQRLDHTLPDDAQISALEKTSILVSMNNLMGFPFVQDAVEQNRLTLHALWHDIDTGSLYGYDPNKAEFLAL